MAGLTRGDSETQVQQWFVQEYGLTVLAAPVNRGFGRVAWVTPFAVFLGALLVATLVIRNWRRHPLAVGDHQGEPASRELTTYRDQASRAIRTLVACPTLHIRFYDHDGSQEDMHLR